MFFVPATRRSYFAPSFFDRFFEEAAGSQAEKSEAGDKVIELSFDLPGIAREQLSIGIEGKVVRIETLPGAKRQYKAAYELMQEIDAASSEAKLENGVLTLKLAKVQPQDRSVKLTIN